MARAGLEPETIPCGPPESWDGRCADRTCSLDGFGFGFDV